MDLFDQMQDYRYGDLHVFSDEATGLRALIAVHSTRLGPAIGGCRAIRYKDSESAVFDVLRLARGMSYKAAISGLKHGGGKAVISLPEGGIFDREALFAAFGRAVDSLGGRYVTCEDSGTSPHDMDVVARHTRHVLGTSSGTGDPSPYTAHGVRRGIEAAVRFSMGADSLRGIRVAVQGVGHVGARLVDELVGCGAQVTVADVNTRVVEELVARHGVGAVAPDAIVDVDCDVFAPCALGAVINDASIERLKARIVAGAANNVLLEPRHGDALHQLGILYAPDYAINAGGLIKVSYEYGTDVFDGDAAWKKTASIYDTMLVIFERSRVENVPTWRVADQIAEERMYGLS